MFDTLVESRPRSSRQHQYTIMSVVAHAGLIAAAAAATDSVVDARKLPDPPVTVITYLPDIRQRVPDSQAVPIRSADGSTASAVPVPDATTIPVPTIPTGLTTIPSGLPDPTATLGLPSGGAAATGPIFPGAYAGVPGGEAYTTSQVERIAVLRNATPPRYPATLRAASTEGEVVVRFVVDTAGLVERGSVVVTRSSHDSFTAAVLEVIPRLRFAPATIGGRGVRQLVELPFTFRLDR